MALLSFIKDNPKATQREMAAYIGKSERTVKSLTVKLTQKGILERKGSRRDGYWQVNTQ